MISFYETASNSRKEQIASLKPEDADAFQKILKDTSQLTRRINIFDSNMVMGISDTAVMEADLTPLLGENVNMHFNCNEDSLKSIRTMKGNEKHLILHDPEHHEFIISNGTMSVKFSEVTATDRPTVPDLSSTNADAVTENLVTDESTLIKPFMKGSPYTTIYVFGNQIGIFERHDGRRYCIGKFSEFEYDNIQPDYIFRSFSFLPITGALATFGIYELKTDPIIFCLRTIITKGFRMEIKFFDRITLIWRK